MKFREISIKFGLSWAILAMCCLSVAAQPAPKQEQLLNGLKVLMWPDKTSDKVMVRLRIHSGAAFDQQGKEGTMQMLADNLFPNPAAREFFTEDLGGSLEIITTYDYIQVNASSKPDQMLTMLETLSSAVSNPQIDKETTAQLQTALLAKIRALETDPNYVGERAVAKRLFGAYPYGRAIMGTEATVGKLVFADLVDAKQRFLTADNATIAVVGNFDRSLTFKAIRRYFGGWLKSDKRVPATFQQPEAPEKTEIQVTAHGVGRPQVWVGRWTPGRMDKDYYPLLAYLQLRKDLGCPDEHIRVNLLRGTYWIRSEKPASGLPIENASCSLTRMGGDGKPILVEQNIEVSRAKVVAELRSRASTPPGLADLWLDIDTYKLGSLEDEIKRAGAVTIADVNTAATKIWNSPPAVVVIAPPAN